MKKTILLAAFVATAMFVNAQQAASPSVQQAPAAPAQAVKPQPTAEELKNMADFKFEEDTAYFGTIKQGETWTHEFNFTNTGKEPLVITGAHGSCGCTVPEFPKEPIKKGMKSAIKVTFNSAGKQGMQIKTVTIDSNAKQNPKVIYIKGNVEKPADPTPAPVQDNQQH